MPPQKNAGNRGAKRETGVSLKNQTFIHNFMDDLKKEGNVENVFIGRITKKMGNGRMEVFYMNQGRRYLTNTKIRGSFCGRGKRSVWIDVGSFVAIAGTGLGGSLAFEIVAVLSADQVRDINRYTEIDPRILDITNTDTANIISDVSDDITQGFEFNNEEEVDIDNI